MVTQKRWSIVARPGLKKKSNLLVVSTLYIVIPRKRGTVGIRSYNPNVKANTFQPQFYLCS